MTAPGCIVGTAIAQFPTIPQCSQLVEVRTSDVEMAVAWLLPVTPPPEISITMLHVMLPAVKFYCNENFTILH